MPPEPVNEAISANDRGSAYYRQVNEKAERVPRKLIVAGLVIDEGRVLLTQRLASGSHPLEWEFPGGKVEPGESPEAALARELAEEVGLKVEVGRIWDVLHHRYPEFEIVMLVYAVWPSPGSASRCLEVADLRWLDPAEVAEHPILAADQKLVDRLVAEGVPTYHFDRGR